MIILVALLWTLSNVSIYFLKMLAPCLLAVLDDESDQGDLQVFDIFHAFVCVGPTNCP